MTGAPPQTDKPSDLELADAAAYIAWRDNPCEATDAAWRRAHFALTGGEIHRYTPTRCEQCGLHRSYLKPEDPCRHCCFTSKPWGYGSR